MVDVYIKPTGIKCSYDARDDCDHVKFALSSPEVRDLIKKKGWRKIELPDA